jgi:hypothetical protein
MVGKDVGGSDRGLRQGTVPEFDWKDWRKTTKGSEL